MPSATHRYAATTITTWPHVISGYTLNDHAAIAIEGAGVASVQATVSGGGLTWTPIEEIQSGGNNSALFAFQGAGTPDGSDISVDWEASPGDPDVGTVILTEIGDHGSAPWFNTQAPDTNSGTGTAISGALASFAANSGLFFIAVVDNNDGIAPEAGTTELNEQTRAFFSSTMTTNFRNSEDTSPSATAATSDPWRIIAFEISAPAAGGTIYTRTLSDSIAVADSPVRGQRHGRVAQEPGVSLLDSLARGQHHGRVTVDALALTDFAVRGQLHGRVTLDSLQVQDTLRRYALLYRLTTDSFDVFDSLSSTVSGLFVRILADNISVIDVVMRSQLHGRVLGDALVLTDAIVRSQLHGRTLSDQLNLIDSVFRTAFLYRLAQNGIDTTDALAVSITRASTDIGIILMLLEQAQPIASILEQAQPIELKLTTGG